MSVKTASTPTIEAGKKEGAGIKIRRLLLISAELAVSADHQADCKDSDDKARQNHHISENRGQGFHVKTLQTDNGIVCFNVPVSWRKAGNGLNRVTQQILRDKNTAQKAESE